MPHHEETRILPYTPEQMYAVVADVERYPEFVPSCSALRVLKREKDGAVERITAEMIVSYHGLKERYTSLVTLDSKAMSVTAEHIKGPFHHLDTLWEFRPLSGGSEVHFSIDFAFRSVLLSKLAGLAFGQVASRMAGAFIERANVLYHKI